MCVCVCVCVCLCVRSIVGISRRQLWDDRISTATLAATFGVDPDITSIIRRHRLRWLGHIGRMDDSRAPKQLLFGELPAPPPPPPSSSRPEEEVARCGVD